MDQNNSHWPFKTNKPNFEFELILWKLETLHVKYVVIIVFWKKSIINLYPVKWLNLYDLAKTPTNLQTYYANW